MSIFERFLYSLSIHALVSYVATIVDEASKKKFLRDDGLILRYPFLIMHVGCTCAYLAKINTTLRDIRLVRPDCTVGQKHPVSFTSLTYSCLSGTFLKYLSNATIRTLIVSIFISSMLKHPNFYPRVPRRRKKSKKESQLDCEITFGFACKKRQ